jgi:hypothetical protein
MLTFQIPYLVDIRNKLIENPTIKKLKERYLIKYKRRNSYEFFIVKKITIGHDDNGDYLTVECSGTPVQLADKKVNNYSAESKRLQNY